jgi:hypothetical protein
MTDLLAQAPFVGFRQQEGLRIEDRECEDRE